MITVLAGVNGAGKSSIAGSALREHGQDWFNPDDVAREMQLRFPARPGDEINSAVWQEGYERLQQAVKDDSHFAFETTLGGSSITGTLLDAIAAGIAVHVWYCGLSTVELHIERVAARVALGGHDIPKPLIRKRYASSMRNLCRLTPGLKQLAVWDNSLPLVGNGKPQARRLLHWHEGSLEELANDIPDWAKPVAAVCLQHTKR